VSETLTRALIECDGATAPPALAREPWTIRHALRAHGTSPDLNLRIDSLSDVVQTIVVPVASDLLRIAAYTYGADQELSRGGDRDPTDAGWRREIALCVPVVALDVWARDDVQDLLGETLHFATDDTWRFAFSHGDAEAHSLPMFNEREQLYDPDCVLMFSGGADSLCAAVRAVAADDARPLLLSHRSATYFDAWQRQLVEQLRRALPQWRFPHRGCWVQRRDGEARERTRRSRAFLVASLGAAVALQLELTRVLLADNGVVSLNVSLNGSVAGAQASRSTHPQFLHLFNRLLRAIFPAPVRVTNPQWAQTRAEVLSTLTAHHCPELLPYTRSCSRAHGLPPSQPHCGTCSQCIDRRFGVLAAGLEAHDPPSGYAKDAFREALPPGYDRTIGESYLRLAQRIDETPEDHLFEKFGQLFDAVLPSEEGIVSRSHAVQKLLKRHAASVGQVMQKMNAQLSGALWAGAIARTSLLGLLHNHMVAATPSSVGMEDAAIWQRMGSQWRLVFRGHEAYVQDRLGVRYLAHLLGAPNTEISVLDLFNRERGGRKPADALSDIAVQQAMAEKQMRSGGSGELDTPKERAIRRLLRQIDALRTEHETALDLGETNYASTLADQLETLDARLSGAYADLLGNNRLSDQFKRQRQAVTKAIRSAIRLIGEAHPQLGRHLHASVRVALLCSYWPDPPVHWELRLSPSAA